MAYLDTHPPATRQHRPRRLKPSGLIVLHTAETRAQTSPPDNAATAVARYITTRETKGSYHAVVDSGNIVHLVEWEDAAYHVGVSNCNDLAVGLSAACQAALWDRYPTRWVEATTRNLAAAARAYATWLAAGHGTTIPAHRVTVDQARQGQPGFIPHADLDPRRRSDPGPGFPWDLFLDQYTNATNETIGDNVDSQQRAVVRHIQAVLNTKGASLEVDGDPGPATRAAFDAFAESCEDDGPGFGPFYLTPV